MFKNKLFILFVIGSIVLSACSGVVQKSGQPPIQGQVRSNQPVAQLNFKAPVTQTNPSIPVTGADSSTNSSQGVDMTHLPLGDGKVSSEPKVGYVFSCQTQFNGRGASASGDWMNGDGTWNATKKPTVDGSVTWPSSFSITLSGDQRIVTSNDLPNHATGTFPISPSDNAYKYDHNPNSIAAQNISFSLPAHPQLAATPTCVGMGMIGIMNSGVAIFNALDATGHDAVAHEVQDKCDGHPQKNGEYHYHNLSPCIQDSGTGQSQLVGYALDGFGIYGPRDANGKILTNADLDECHGITSEVDWNGQKVVMYHYVATAEYPYTVGCYRGTPVSVRGQQGGGGQGQQLNGGQNQRPPLNGQPNGLGQGQQSGNQTPLNGQQTPQQGNGRQQPPQAALDACSALAQGSTCSINTPNGSLSGTCMTPPNSSQLACVPAGGQP